MDRMSDQRPRVLSGMQPTADSLHLGNYLGALLQWVLASRRRTNALSSSSTCTP